VDGAEVGILEKSDEVSLGSLLEGQDGLGLESNVVLDLAGQVLDDPLEWQLSDEEVSLKLTSIILFSGNV
jgi:hypothetical protein